MIARISPRILSGKIAAIPSKSAAHRLLICAAFADRETFLKIGATNADIEDTIRCLNAFGADIRWENGGIRVRPGKIVSECTADCGESGSTLRFLLPVAGALGIDARFKMHGRLPERPIFPLDRELMSGGCTLSRPENDILRIEGRLSPGTYTLPGNVSSQYITGMLFALTLTGGESTLEITGNTESAAYIDMTLAAMDRFSAKPEKTASGYRITGKKFASPGEIAVEGDWSNAAFWLCAAKIGKSAIEMSGLDPLSTQGDRRIAEELVGMASAEGEYVIDASGIPDLVPAIAAYASLKPGRTRFIHAERLRIKESDRLATVAGTLNALGACVQETADGLIIHGKDRLSGGCVSA
ncbi:MAG: 3-phosphoshikimate 1-carboxyvinyltransferase, partial [Clostridia bacterium]|nr:3-phosphoshikimate 1-carboxyvinyltransferase [Clostridia bacterium]